MAEHDEVRLGMRVRDVNGDVLGTVVRLGAGRFLVQQGTIVKESLIVPDAMVAAVNDGEVVLCCNHRDLIEAMRNPPMDQERDRAERYRYAEMGIEPPRPANAQQPSEGVDTLAEHPGKVRVVREEITVNPGSAREYEIRPKREDRQASTSDVDTDPDRPIH